MSFARPTTVAVARFEDLVARGLRSFIADDHALELVAHGTEQAALGAMISELDPRVVILNLGTLRSATEVHHLHAAHPGTAFVVLANRPTPGEASQMLAFGATACLAKDVEARDVLNAIHLASRGLQVLPRRPVDAVSTTSIGPDLLTPREADVLGHLQHGQSNAEIANALCVGVETVRTHRRNIYRKLGVRTRRELTMMTTPSLHRRLP